MDNNFNFDANGIQFLEITKRMCKLSCLNSNQKFDTPTKLDSKLFESLGKGWWMGGWVRIILRGKESVPTLEGLHDLHDRLTLGNDSYFVLIVKLSSQLGANA